MTQPTTSPESFTIEQIKAAFWQEFHRTGDRWFCDLGSENACNESTETEWRGFESALRSQQNNKTEATASK